MTPTVAASINFITGREGGCFHGEDTIVTSSVAADLTGSREIYISPVFNDPVEGLQSGSQMSTLGLVLGETGVVRNRQIHAANVITSPSPTQYFKGSPSSVLEFLGWKPLEERRLHSKLSLLYKIDQGIVAPATVYLQPVTGSRGHNRKFVVPV